MANLDKYLTIDDLMKAARRRVPKMFFDYADSGAWSEQTYRQNTTDFEKILLRQRVAVNLEDRNLASTMMGQPVTMPVAIAPVGSTGMQSADGEIKAARAAEKFGIPFTLSTMAICSIEDVAENTSKPFWFQLYVMRDKPFIERLIDRAKAAKCPVLVLTMDLQILGQRHKDIRNGLKAPPPITPKFLFEIATKPAWAFGMLGTRRRTFGNIAGHVTEAVDLASLSKWTATQFDLTLNWKDIDWIRSIWPGKLILKGILDVEDAEIAAKTGAQAIVVSNHGGRQLDGAPSSIEVLPEIADTVGSQVEIMFDGGIRTGMDVMRALALGAKSCMIGRAYAYGLGAAGEAGVAKAIDILARELTTTMGLCGVNRISEIDDHVLAT